MAISIIHRLEPVKVEVEQHKRLALLFLFFQGLVETPLVEQAGQAVAVGKALHLFALAGLRTQGVFLFLHFLPGVDPDKPHQREHNARHQCDQQQDGRRLDLPHPGVHHAPVHDADDAQALKTHRLIDQIIALALITVRHTAPAAVLHVFAHLG